MRGHRLLCSAAAWLSVVLLAAACSNGGEKRPAQGTAATSPARADRSDLSSVVVSAPPAGFTPTPGVQGPFDLQQFLEEYSENEAEDRRILTTNGFVRGISRGWSNNLAGTSLVVLVLEFRDARGARSARDYFRDTDLKRTAGAALKVDVPDAVGVSFVEDTESGPQRIQEAFFTRGPRLYIVGAQSPQSRPQPALLSDFAKQQAKVAR